LWCASRETHQKGSTFKQMSVFLAIDLDEPARDQASGVMERFRPTIDAKWVAAEKLHLTLVFLGNPTTAHVESFMGLVDAVAGRHVPFSLELAGVGTFGTARAPAVLWLGVKGSPDRLRTLQADAQRSLVTAELPGLKADEHERIYTPHVTLARSQQCTAFRDVLSALADFASPSFLVGHVTLYESRSDRYRALHRAPLLHDH
jgi:RNA 2',3'-cyclic 3'-phosphodiesterase